jgi:hypothetical protein
MDSLTFRVKASLDWEKVQATKGNTQVSERYYVGVIQDQIVELGGRIGSSAGSQQSVDIRDVVWPDGSIVSIECKKVNKGSTFMFNDTFLKPDVWYLFIWVDKRDVALVKGSTIIEKNKNNEPSCDIKKQIKIISRIVIDIHDGDETSYRFIELFRETIELMKIGVLKGVLSFFDYGELFKNTTKFGNIVSRPRPNWSINLSRESMNTLLESVVEEQHSQVGQSVV